MSAYMVFNYVITNQDAYNAYPPAAMPSLRGAGAEVLVADYASETKEGSPGHVTVVLRFESKDAALKWYDSAEYQAVRPLRIDNTSGIALLCDGLAARAG
jgi:uncharacterized protein (DUF1330 family)